MLEAGIAIIAACLPTLGPLVSDKNKNRVSKTIQNLLTSSRRPNRPSKTYNKISEGNLVSNEQNVRSLGVESFVMGDVKTQSAALNGPIKVTTGTSQHFSMEV